MQISQSSTTSSYFVINSHRQYEPYRIDVSLLNIQNCKRLPVSSRCHRLLKDDNGVKDKENMVKQGQVLNVYYKSNLMNNLPPNKQGTQTTIKKSALGFDIERNLQSIDKSIFLYQKYNQANHSSKTNNNGSFNQILYQSSNKQKEMLNKENQLHKSAYNNEYNNNNNEIEASVSQKLYSSSEAKPKKSRLKAYKQKIQSDINQQESVGMKVVESGRNSINVSIVKHLGQEQHTPHKLIHKKLIGNNEESNSEVKRSIIEDVMMLKEKHQQNEQSLQLSRQTIHLQSTYRQLAPLQTFPLPKNKLITHLLTPSQRQLPIQKQDQKVSDLHPKQCESVIFEPQFSAIQNREGDYYQQEMKRRQQADYILSQLGNI